MIKKKISFLICLTLIILHSGLSYANTCTSVDSEYIADAIENYYYWFSSWQNATILGYFSTDDEALAAAKSAPRKYQGYMWLGKTTNHFYKGYLAYNPYSEDPNSSYVAFVVSPFECVVEDTDYDSDGDGVPDKDDVDSQATERKGFGLDPQACSVNRNQNLVADPINIFNGNLIENQTDLSFNSSFEGGLTFKRFYNSQETSETSVGYGWIHDYNVVLNSNFGDSSQLIEIIDGTGRGIYFDDNDEDGVFKGAFSETSSISEDPDGNYVWDRTDGWSLQFDMAKGNLLSITDKFNNVQTLTYNSDDLLETVSDEASGRSLSFSYNQENKIAYITGPATPAVPDGVWVSYNYDANGNLIRVTYADDGNGSGASGFEYRYEDPNDPNNMTAKYDLAGNLISTWVYDDQDRAVENVNREGKGGMINYDDPSSVIFTDAYGLSNTYGITEIAGRKKIVSKTGASNCNTCSSGIVRTDFDLSTGYPTEREYANGRIDQYQDYGDEGNPGAMITGVGSENENIVITTWHSVLSTPLTRTQKSLLADDGNPDRNRVSIWDYDDPAADGDTDTPNENPTTLIHRMIIQGFTHDDTGAVAALEQITTYAYNDKGQVVSVNGPLAGGLDSITFSYDAATGDLLTMTRPLAGTTSFTHDAAGNILTATDENQVQTVFTYDGRNRQISAAADGAASAQTFTAAGTLASQTDRTGRTQNLSYDTKGFLQKLTDPSGNFLFYSYDENGNPIESSIFSAAGIKTLFRGYDYGDPASDATLAPGKPAKALARNQDDSATLETLFAYEHGKLIRITDPAATVKDFVYDNLNRLVQTTEQQTDTVTADTLYAYDLNNNLIQVTDPEGLITSYVYDDAGRLVKQVSPDTGTTGYNYDTAGNLILRQANDGIETLYTYDELGRRTGIQYPDADQDVLFFYDSGINGKGRLTGISHAGDAYAFSYDAMGNLITAQRTTTETTFTTSYGYDASARLISMVYPDGRTVSFERDTAGAVSKVTTVKEGVSQVLAENIDYKPFGPLSSMILGSGQAVSKNFDLNYRPLDLTAPGVLERSLSYDSSGRITAVTDHLDSSRTQGFAYDRAGRLTSATGGYGSLSFTYDKTGNRLTRTLAGADLSYAYTPGTNLLSGITGADSQTDLTYDNNGKPLTKGNLTFDYTDAGRLSSASKSDTVLAQYLYNVFGQRTRKISDNKTTLYHYDLLGNLIGESTPDGDFFMDYVYVDNTRLAAISSDPDNVFEVRVATSTGRTIEGIKVYAFTEAGSYAGIYATTDVGGIAVFQKAQLTGSSYAFRADYLNEQFWTATLSLSTSGTDLTIEETAQTVTIIQSSAPVAGIKVYVFDENGRYLGLYAVTDASGQVSFNLPLGHDYRFRADILGSQYFSDTITTTGEETVIDSQGGILTFALTRDNAVPLTGIKTYVFSDAGRYLGKSSTTDSQGQALFDLPAGTYKVRCDYLGYQFWSQTFSLPASRSAILTIPHRELTLSALKTSGTASDPVTGIKTYLFTESGTYLGITKTTDSAGRNVYILPEKSYKLRGDYLSTHYWSEPFTWTDPAITIPHGTITLNLTNAGQPLSDVKTYVFSDQGQYLGFNSFTNDQGQVSFTLPKGTYTFRADWLDNQYWSEALTVTANETTLADISTGGGTVTLTAKKDDQTVLEGIKAYLFNEAGSYLSQNTLTDASGRAAFTLGNGTYKIRLDYFGYQFWTETFTIPDDTAVNLVIPHNQITATVSTANAGETSPLAGTKVYLFTESGTYMGQNAVTDASGQVAFNLPEHPYKLRADYMGGQYWSEVFTTTNQSIEIPQGNALVRVGDESTPLFGVKVYVFNDTNTYMGQNSITNAEGVTEFDLPQGTWKFRADYLGSQYWAEGSVLPNQENSIEINPGGGSLTLTLEKAPGSPLNDIKVYAFSSSGSYLGLNQTSSGTGQVSFDLPEGEYKFRADYLGYQFWSEVLSVPEITSQILSIPHQDVTVTVQGQYQESFSIQASKTYLFTASGSYQGINATTDANGQAIYSLPEKAYKVRADYLGSQYWSEETVQADQTITVDHGNALINVTQSDTPVTGARVYLFSESGSYLGQSTSTDSTGSSGFILPVNTYKFRVDHGGSQYWSDSVDLIVAQNVPVDLNLDTLALNLTANPHYARYDGEMPKKEEQQILLASIGSLAGYEDNGSTQPGTMFYINDHLGTPLKVIDDDGQVVWDGAYLPFGQASDNVGDAQNQFRFPGQYFDGETGLHYNWHRYYDPETGRYLTPDPIGLKGGINPFVYSLNDPINNFDPMGLMVWGWMGDVSGGIIGVVDGSASVLFEGLFEDVALALDVSGSMGLQVSADLGTGPVIAPFANKISDLGADSYRIRAAYIWGAEIAIPKDKWKNFSITLDLLPGIDFGVGWGAGWTWLFGEDVFGKDVFGKDEEAPCD